MNKPQPNNNKKFPEANSYHEIIGYLEKELNKEVRYYWLVIGIGFSSLLLWGVLFLAYLKKIDLFFWPFLVAYFEVNTDLNSWQLFEKTFPAVVWPFLISAFSSLEIGNYKKKIYAIMSKRFKVNVDNEEYRHILDQMRISAWEEFADRKQSSWKDFNELNNNKE